jgi:hypothetical protein
VQKGCVVNTGEIANSETPSGVMNRRCFFGPPPLPTTPSPAGDTAFCAETWVPPARVRAVCHCKHARHCASYLSNHVRVHVTGELPVEVTQSDAGYLRKRKERHRRRQ